VQRAIIRAKSKQFIAIEKLPPLVKLFGEVDKRAKGAACANPYFAVSCGDCCRPCTGLSSFFPSAEAVTLGIVEAAKKPPHSTVSA
jgi:hypothetical protein